MAAYNQLTLVENNGILIGYISQAFVNSTLVKPFDNRLNKFKTGVDNNKFVVAVFYIQGEPLNDR